ncbi:MAG: hypothetical protein ACRD4V_04790 [Candidatus Acidiferrales bacterium]
MGRGYRLGLDSGSITVVAICDENASVYLSTGGGYIGAQAQESIRHAAENMITLAKELRPQMQPTTSYPLPQSDEVIFYVLTDAGVFTATASVTSLSSQQNPMAKLGNAAQEIITQYRATVG